MNSSAHPPWIELYTPEEYAATFEVVRGRAHYGKYGTGSVVRSAQTGDVLIHLPRGGRAFVARLVSAFRTAQTTRGITPTGRDNPRAHVNGTC